MIAEQAFEKLLSTLVGASTPAAATVLAVYFGGLTIGGFLYGVGRKRGIKRPLFVYAVLEGSVGLWALFLFLSFDRLVSLFAPLLALGVDRPALLLVLRVAVAGVWILPATIPMGASFPAIVDGIEQIGGEDHRRLVSRFYGFNLLGAILASVLGPFYAFPRWGLDGGLLFAFLINAGVAAIGFFLARAIEQGGAAAGASAPTAGEASSGRLLAVIALYSGFQFFALEVLWTHLIAAVLGNSVYSFAAMLGIVLIGLGIGAAMTSRRFPDRREVPFSEVGRLLAVGALFCAVMAGRWPDAPAALVTLGHSLNSFSSSEMLRWLIAGLLLLPVAIPFGMVFPTLFRLKEFPLVGSGRTAGRLVAFNALGSILGALLTGFFLIPRIGSEATLILLTSMAGLLALWILGSEKQRARRFFVYAVLAIAIALFQPRWNKLALTSGQGVYFSPGPVGPTSVLRYFREDPTGGFTTVVQNIGETGKPFLTLLTNGKFQGNDSGEIAAQSGFAIVPMMFVRHFDDGLSIGLGTGRTAYVLSALGFTSVDIAEISSGIVDASPFFATINGSLLRRPNTRLFLEDGRNVLLLREKKYDLITIELTSVWFAGATNLYSEEFYQLARRRLKPDGVLQQWIQFHHITAGELGMVMATARSVFPYVSFWTVGGQGLVVASNEPQQIQSAFFDTISARSAQIGWSREELDKSLRDLVSSRLLSAEDISSLMSRSRFVLNTDRNRLIEYLTPRYNNVHIDFYSRNLRFLSQFASFSPPLVAPEARGALAEACRAIGRDDYLRVHGLAISPRP